MATSKNAMKRGFLMAMLLTSYYTTAGGPVHSSLHGDLEPGIVFVLAIPSLFSADLHCLPDPF
jgi:hypothetical protein